MNNTSLRFLGMLRDEAQVGPQTVDISITNDCNYKCLFCWSHGKYGYRKRKKIFFPYWLFKKIVDDCKHLGVHKISLPGVGEPLLHPRIYDMIEYVKNRNLGLWLFTNGSLKIKRPEILAKIDNLLINLSAGCEKTFRKIQLDKKNGFSDVLRNIRILSKLKKNNGLPKITIVCLLTSYNFMEAGAILKLAKELDIDFVKFKFFYPLSTMEHLLVSGDKMHQLGLYLKKIIDSRDSFIPKTNLLEIHEVATAAYKEYKPVILKRLKVDDHLYFKYFERKFDRNFQCLNGWMNSIIDIDGNIYSCCLHSHLKAGNVYRNSFRQIWEGGEFSKIRLLLKYRKNQKDDHWQRCHLCDNIKKLQDLNRKLCLVKKYFRLQPGFSNKMQHSGKGLL